MDRIIEVKINGSHLTKDNAYAGVQGEANVTALRIEFDDGWDGYAKKVVFWNALGENPVERTLTADMLEDITVSRFVYLCPISGEALEYAGKCEFVVEGYMDGKRQRSVSDMLKVKRAPVCDTAGEPVDPTPTQAEQLQAQIDTILDDMQERAVIAENAAAGAKISETNAAASEVNAKASEESAAQSAKYAYEAVLAQEAIENMTATGTNVPADSDTPVVVKSFNEDGTINMHFNTRQGVSGVFVGGGEMPDGFDVQVDYESGDDAVDIYGLVDEAERWANAAQSYAEQATVPAVDGVYNVVLTDRVTSDRYALIVESGRLKLLGVSAGVDATELTLIDNDTGTSYAVVVDSGKLILEEV